MPPTTTQSNRPAKGKQADRQQEYAQVPLPELSRLLEQPLAPKLRNSLAHATVSSLMDRTMDESKRARRDTIVAMSVLSAYEKRGGSR